jgi:hypothetical protein
VFRAFFALVIVFGSYVGTSPQSDPPAAERSIAWVVLTEQANTPAELTPAPAAPVIPAAVPIAPVPIDFTAATRWALRQLPAREMLLEVMGPRRFAALAPKITRESGWNCGVNNRHSSAAGLGQTLRTAGRIQLLASHELGSFTWDEVRGPDCLADVLLIERLYEACGLGDWTPPYRCLRPLPK